MAPQKAFENQCITTTTTKKAFCPLIFDSTSNGSKQDGIDRAVF